MYTMKRVCEQTGLTYETLKFYCNQGLIPDVQRDFQNRRIFTDENVRWIKGLICLKNCGMGIREMKEYSDLCIAGDSTIPYRKEILKTKRQALLEEQKRIRNSIAYIDWKERYYDAILAGETAPPFLPDETEADLE